MKKIIIVLFIFILSGCSVQDEIDNLEKAGYIKKELDSGVALYTMMDAGGDKEGQLVIVLDQQKELIALGAQLNKNDKVLSITQEKNGAKNCIILEKDNEIKNGKIVDCDEAYQYGLEENPTLIETFEENLKKFNVLNDPYETNVSDGLKNIFDKSVLIKNFSKKGETLPGNAEKLGENPFLKNMVFSFDIVNTSKTTEISIEKALENYGLCNVADLNEIKCEILLEEKEIEKYKEEIIKPNEKKTIIFEKKTLDIEPKYQLGILTEVVGLQSETQLLGSFDLKSGDFHMSSEELVELEDLRANISKMSNSEIIDKIADWKKLSEEEKQVIAEYLYGLSKYGEQARVLEIYTDFLTKYPKYWKNIGDINIRITKIVSFEIAKKFIENDSKVNEEILKLLLIHNLNFEYKEFLADVYYSTRHLAVNSIKIDKIKYDENEHLQIEYRYDFRDREGNIYRRQKSFDGINSMIYNSSLAQNDVAIKSLKGIRETRLTKLTEEEENLIKLCGFIKGNISKDKYSSAGTQYVFTKLLENPEFVESYKKFLQAINNPDSEKDLFSNTIGIFSGDADKLMGDFNKEIEKSFKEEKND